MSWSVSRPRPPIVLPSRKGRRPHSFFFLRKAAPRRFCTWPIQSLFTISTPSPYGLSATASGYDLLSPSPMKVVYRKLCRETDLLQISTAPVHSIALADPSKCLLHSPLSMCFCFQHLYSSELGSSWMWRWQLTQTRLFTVKSTTLPLPAAIARTTPYKEEKPRLCQVPSTDTSISTGSLVEARSGESVSTFRHISSPAALMLSWAICTAAEWRAAECLLKVLRAMGCGILIIPQSFSRSERPRPIRCSPVTTRRFISKKRLTFDVRKVDMWLHSQHLIISLEAKPCLSAPSSSSSVSTAVQSGHWSHDTAVCNIDMSTRRNPIGVVRPPVRSTVSSTCPGLPTMHC